MSPKVVKSTSKGQITLPQEWRRQFSTDSFILNMNNKTLIVTPINLDELEPEEVVFDADRDNDGKGITPSEMIRILKKIRNE
ncbi:MAG: AbrB/MazE/SpoVT family DNA-binding domain-containing protein [Patescibacteria group bacterium]